MKITAYRFPEEMSMPTWSKWLATGIRVSGGLAGLPTCCEAQMTLPAPARNVSSHLGPLVVPGELSEYLSLSEVFTERPTVHLIENPALVTASQDDMKGLVVFDVVKYPPPPAQSTTQEDHITCSLLFL